MGEDAVAMTDIGSPTRPAWLEEQAGVNISGVKRTFLAVGLSPTHKGNIQ